MTQELQSSREPRHPYHRHYYSRHCRSQRAWANRRVATRVGLRYAGNFFSGPPVELVSRYPCSREGVILLLALTTFPQPLTQSPRIQFRRKRRPGHPRLVPRFLFPGLRIPRECGLCDHLDPLKRPILGEGGGGGGLEDQLLWRIFSSP